MSDNKDDKPDKPVLRAVDDGKVEPEPRPLRQKTDFFFYVLFGGLLLVAIGLVLAPFMIYNAWALSLLWKWFVAEPFGVKQLSIPNAIGLISVVGMLRQDWSKTFTGPTIEDLDPDKRAERLRNIGIAVLIAPMISVAIGYVVHLFM